MSTYYGCPGCQTGSTAGHICGIGTITAGMHAHNIIGGNVYSSVTWTSNNTGASYVICSTCGAPLSTCQCANKYTWMPNPVNPLISPQMGQCIYCGMYGCSGMCRYNSGGISTGTTTIPWTVLGQVIDWLNDVKLFDIQTEDAIKGHDSLLTILTRTPEKGFLGTLEYIKLPSLFQNYFLKVGKDESAMDIWYMVSPLVFRMISQDKDKKEVSHMVVVLGVKNLELEETKEETIVYLKKVRLLEIKDNLTFIQIAERDAAFRKHISK